MSGFSAPELLLAALAVALGAFLGGALRGLLRHRPGGLRGTWTANLSACLVLGVLLGSGLGTSGSGVPVLWQLALGTGFSGALSTWSTLAGELGSLLRERSWRHLLRYLVATLAGGLLVGWVGWELGSFL
ncbi:fluoride efflux transporter FluC [Corynebacterium sp. A21]|uniref:fluoride efflux transporter FluC n=1 Tax=Corynebacterium sp. A21 TaxID=3457318 RepID=UPI003FCF0F27